MSDKTIQELNEEINDTDMKESLMLYIQYSLKTIDKKILKDVNEICKSWKKEIADMFGQSQKKLSEQIIELSKENNEDQICEILFNELHVIVEDEYLSEENDEKEDKNLEIILEDKNE